MKTFLQRNQLIIPSYQSYGIDGFQDYGINGCILKNKVINKWKSLMINDNIHEVELPTTMPYDILKASGHLDRFIEYVVNDDVGKCHRADHLVNKYFNIRGINHDVDNMSLKELESIINETNMVGSLIKVEPKTLMIKVGEKDFLRPELAQGIFVNFQQYASYLLKDTFSQFGIAQLGKSYRKEISPQSFVRMQEFTQGEIEYFFDPKFPSHKNFHLIKQLVIPIGESQLSIGESVDMGIINHQLMGYFIAKMYQFVLEIGLDPNKIRFRKHDHHEMAHYANQCWDLEVYIDGSWLECAGCADRGSYDLLAHSAKQSPSYRRVISYSIIAENSDPIIEYEEFIPNIVEPSFGIDRLIYALINHCVWNRVNGDKTVLSLPFCINMYEVAVFSLQETDDLCKIRDEIKNSLRECSCFIDNSNIAITDKYIRCDEIGVQYVITVGPESLTTGRVMMRDRDTMEQIIIHKDAIVRFMNKSNNIRIII